jgi:Tfp pilus assembly protein PilN
VLGVLVALLVGVVAYVLTANQVTSKKDELAAVTQEAQTTQAKVAALGSFGNFASIKQTREQSVAQLAQARLDWERLMRELARVLPADVFINNLDAAATATASADAAGGSSGGPPTPPPGAPARR